MKEIDCWLSFSRLVEEKSEKKTAENRKIEQRKPSLTREITELYVFLTIFFAFFSFHLTTLRSFLSFLCSCLFHLYRYRMWDSRYRTNTMPWQQLNVSLCICSVSWKHRCCSFLSFLSSRSYSFNQCFLQLTSSFQFACSILIIFCFLKINKENC